MASKVVCQAVHFSPGWADNAAMPRKARSIPKAARRPTQIKAWRKHRDLTLAKLSERLFELEALEISDAQLSRIERGAQPYSQDLLEALARVLRCGPADLIMRAPGSAWSVWEQATPVEREEAEAYIETRRRMTGTNGS